MIKTNMKIINLIDALSDGLLVLGSYYLSCWLWLEVLVGAPNMAGARGLNSNIGLAALAYAVGMVLLLAVFRMYNNRTSRRIRMDLLIILEADVLGLLGIGSLLYLLRLQEFSRGVLFLFFLITGGVLSCKHILIRKFQYELRKRGYNLKHILVVGTGPLARQYIADIHADWRLGYRVAGVVGVASDEPMEKYLGGIDLLDQHLNDTQLDSVVIALEPDEVQAIRNIIGLCEKHGVKASIIPSYNDIIPTHPTLEVIGHTKLINLRSNMLENYGYAAIKRGGDILISALLLLILSPLLLLTALGVKLSSPGPVFFRQERVGRGRRNFTMYKFRSMRVNPVETTAWTTNEDPRKTRFGSFIRKCSIDELPQLFNVLKGDMSLVGPRPEIPHFVEQFMETVPLYMVKHQVRPGITGWAQVNGYRGDTSIEKRIECDLWYIENWSVGLDVRILFRTILGGWMNHEKLKAGDKNRTIEHKS